MKKRLTGLVLMGAFCLMTWGSQAIGGTGDASQVREELEALKSRIEELEGRLHDREQPEKHVADGEKKDNGWLMDRLGTLSIHGNVVGYFQGGVVDRIGGEKFENQSGGGFSADLELSFEPIQNGEFFMRLHAGDGKGMDKDLEDELFANLNSLADDNPGDEGIDLLEAYYTHQLHESFAFYIGKTEPLLFLDDNEFANDAATQFVGKAFVNNPVLAAEDEYSPLAAFEWQPLPSVTLAAVVQSSSYPLLDDGEQKSRYDQLFDRPFWGVQAKYSPEWNGLEGNYRIYGWSQTYAHPRIERDGTEAGWGIGLSVDQWVHEKVGLFARFGYQNKEVYEVPWFWSVGAHLQGIIPSRDEDVLGLGVAGLKANDRLESSGTELHLESYYRIVLSEHFAVSPHLQYVIHPKGNSDNDNVFAGMLKAEWSF